MLKKICCYLCLSVNKRTINIYKTDLQYVYENLAGIKLYDDECWMCYICHKRLQQCLRLQQLAIKTRGLIDDLCQNKVNLKFGAIVSLLELSISKTKIFTKQPSLPDVKQETDIKSGPSDDDENDQDILEYKHNKEANRKSTIKLEVKPVKEEYVEIREEQNAGLYVEKPRIEFKIEIEDGCIEPEDEEENNYECDIEDHGNEQQSSCYKALERKLSCHVCTKTFTYKSQLLRHIKAHTGDKPYNCDICLKKFSDKNNLKKHKQTHTGDKPFNCDVCMKNFIQRSALTKHIRVHTGEKPFACDVCGKKFSVKQSLENHIRTHTGDKPFSCDVCLKKFIEKSTLLNHIKTHTGEKPFMCDVCSKKFKLRAALNNHIRTHTGDKPYSCDVCFKSFSRTSHLYRHKKNLHKRTKL